MLSRSLRLAILGATLFTTSLYANQSLADTVDQTAQNVTAVSSLVNTDGTKKVLTKKPTAADQKAAAIASQRNAQSIADAKAAVEAEKAITFEDVKDHWAKPYINDFVKSGILEGPGEGEFKPDEALSTADAEALYNKLIAVTKTDIANTVANKYKANKKKTVKEPKAVTGETLLAPFAGESKITRQEFAQTAATYAQYKSDLEEVATGVVDKKEKSKKTVAKELEAAVNFSDASDISSEYQESIGILASKGFISSGKTLEFRPTEFITRAEAVTMLYRIKHNEVAPAPKAVEAPETVTTVTNETGTAAATKTDAKADTKVEANVDSAKTTAAETKSQNNATPSKTTTTKESAVTTTDAAKVSLENRIFKKLNGLYKTPANFQNYGVMYWQDNQLHVALKSADDLDTLEENIADDKSVDKVSGKTLKDSVVLESTKYSQAEYDRIEANFRKYYAQKQPAGAVLSAYPSVLHNQLIVTVNKSFEYMNDSIKNAFGTKVHIFVLES
ncbi:S-layer homology domain-containing protein [uncultured Veillonella sp.]|uniref:S-layer homology domain-containing protein n=1 Tax=uncultured Veillonella sp. TaxID=159268 RepID=UPI0025D8BCA0|nr:S-layer homology domain-containing protein [uncultured Veillonella sp.]MDY3973077.1 S-layer homology domain-containing protein [Veillonella caviae]